MRSHSLLRFTPFLCALFFGHAIAEPVTYSFTGYFATRDTVTQRLPPWELGPPGFSGTLVLDLDHTVSDPASGQDVITPLESVDITDTAGRTLHVPWSGGELLLRSSPNGGDEAFLESVKSVGTGDARYLVDLVLEWRAPGQGQLPQEPRAFDPTALDPKSWLLHIEARPVGCDIGCVRDDVITGQLSSLTRLASFSGSISRFTNGAAGWQPQGGTWVADGGVYRNTSNQAAAISLLNAKPGSAYRIDTRMNLQWSANGNRGGVVYDYVNANNYRALLISPSNSSHFGGVLEVIEVVGGVRHVVGRSTQNEPPYFVGPQFFAGTFANVTLSRDGDVTRVLAGIALRITLTQPTVVGGSVGSIASWNLVRFDDFVLGAQSTQ